MRPAAHLAVSAVVSTSIYAVTKSAPAAAASFLCGFLLDVDHFLEYVREYGFRIKSNEFFRIFHETRFKKLILVFHAWEWTIGLLFLAWLSGWNEVILGSFIGLFHHMVSDQFTNGVTPGGYSFVWRAANRFSMKAIVREDVVNRKRMRMNM